MDFGRRAEVVDQVLGNGASTRIAHAARVGDRRRHEIVIPHGDEVDEGDAVGDVGRQGFGHP